jgi:hypothetical protein
VFADGADGAGVFGRFLVVAASALPIALGACGGGSDGPESAIEQGAEVMATAVADASTVCEQAQLATVRVAVEAYTALNGEPPADLADLVPDLLVEQPVGWTIVDGRVQPEPGGPCDPSTTGGG